MTNLESCPIWWSNYTPPCRKCILTPSKFGFLNVCGIEHLLCNMLNENSVLSNKSP